MRIGIQLGSRVVGGNQRPGPGWGDIGSQARAAEDVGFDIAVIADGLQVPGGGYWEATTLAGAVAATTSRIEIGHSVINTPLRHPAVIAKAAETLDEISGGRYVLGIGSGNTPEDYELFAIPADPRYARFREAIEIIHGLLKHGRANLEGTYHTAHDAPFEPRGPRPQGPPIVIAALGPKMQRLAARFADQWNTWAVGLDDPLGEQVGEQVEELERACEEVGRDPATLPRSLDLMADPAELVGRPAKVAEAILGLAAAGFVEVRCLPRPAPADQPGTIEAMADLVEAVHAG